MKRSKSTLALCGLALALGMSTMIAHSADGSGFGPPPGPNSGANPQARVASNPVFEPELIYKPIKPCRAFDTRASEKIPTNSSVNLVVAGTSQFANQGGPSAGCGVPDYATAVSISLTAVNESGSGSLTAGAAGASGTPATVLSYTRNVQMTAGATVSIGSNKIRIATVGASTHVFGDVTGYYAQQIEGLVYPTSIYSGSSGLVSVAKISAGVFDVTVDRDVTYCTTSATAYYGNNTYANAKAFNGNVVRVYSWYLDSGHNPVNYDNYVYLAVHC